MLTKILCVDDDANILNAYQRTLRKRFDLDTALSGAQGLELIERQGPYAVVVADMQMPEIGELGIYFVETLSEQQIHPLFGWQQGHYLIIINSQTGRETVIPIQKDTETVKGRAARIQEGIPLKVFKQNIRDVVEGAQ